MQLTLMFCLARWCNCVSGIFNVVLRSARTHIRPTKQKHIGKDIHKYIRTHAHMHAQLTPHTTTPKPKPRFSAAILECWPWISFVVFLSPTIIWYWILSVYYIFVVVLPVLSTPIIECSSWIFVLMVLFSAATLEYCPQFFVAVLFVYCVSQYLEITSCVWFVVVQT